MASKALQDATNSYLAYAMRKGLDEQVISAMIQACETAYLYEQDIEYGKLISGRTTVFLKDFIKQKTGGTFEQLEAYQQEHKTVYEQVEQYYKLKKLEAPYSLDSFMLYIEKNRPREERFYEPRRTTLLKISNKLQMLEDDKLDELFVHLPPRVGKSQLMTNYSAWHIARDMERSNLYVTYKEGLGGAYLDGVKEILTDPTYCFADVFPECKIVDTDAKNNKLDVGRVKKYKSLSGKGLESGLNGEYDAYGVLILDDILEGVQDVMSPDILRRKQIVFDNNVMSRKKQKCKIIWNGTIWSLHDIYMNRRTFLETNPEAKGIRWDVIKIPALNAKDESNFDYDYGVGYDTSYYKTLRAKFEDNEDLAGWSAQYQQEPIERDGAVFKPEHMNFYNGTLPNEEPLKIVAVCDVALGGGDFLSFPVAYVYEDGSVYIHDVVFDNAEKGKTQPQVVNAIVNNNVKSAFFEANQGGEGYKDDISRMLKEIKDFNHGKGINLTSKYAPTSKRKEQRIWDNAERIREFYFRDSTSQNKQYRRFMTNLYSFTINGRNKHDDAPDSLSTLVDFIDKGSGAKPATISRSWI